MMHNISFVSVKTLPSPRKESVQDFPIVKSLPWGGERGFMYGINGGRPAVNRPCNSVTCCSPNGQPSKRVKLFTGCLRLACRSPPARHSTRTRRKKTPPCSVLRRRNGRGHARSPAGLHHALPARRRQRQFTHIVADQPVRPHKLKAPRGPPRRPVPNPLTAPAHPGTPEPPRSARHLNHACGISFSSCSPFYRPDALRSSRCSASFSLKRVQTTEWRRASSQYLIYVVAMTVPSGRTSMPGYPVSTFAQP